MPRRRRKPESNGNRWLATYGDMVTLLLAFFVMLYSMSTVDVLRWAAFVEGLAVPFGNNSAEGMLPASDGLLPDGSGMDPVAPFDQPETANVDESDRPEPEDDLDEISALLQEALEAAGLDAIVEQRREERGLVVSIATDDVLFALGSTEIDARGRRIIGEVARILGEFSNPMMIEGYTDDIPLRRPGYDNWNLSTDRAVAVLKYMVDHHGVPPTQVGAAGYGEYRPLVPNTSKANRAQNRRVEIVVLRHDGQERITDE